MPPVVLRGGTKSVGIRIAMAMAVYTNQVLLVTTAAFSTSSMTMPFSLQSSQLRSNISQQPKSQSLALQSLLVPPRFRFVVPTTNRGMASKDCGCDDNDDNNDDGDGAPLQTRNGGNNTNNLENLSIGNLLRKTVLTNIEGNAVKLGDFIGDGENDTTIVVFLRHLA